MKMITNFSSSNVAAFGWDAMEQELVVEFHDGSEYRYDVDEDMFEDMQSAKSKGKFVHQYLRGHEV